MITASPSETSPRSPCSAFWEFSTTDVEPVELSVAAILWPMLPLLPTPMMTILPRASVAAFSASTLLAIAIVLAAGAGAVWAAGGSLPGEWLHPLKVAAEDVHLALTWAPEDRSRHPFRVATDCNRDKIYGDLFHKLAARG